MSVTFVACLALPSFAFAATDETSAAEEFSAGEASIVSVDYAFDAPSLPNSGRVSVKQEIQGDGYEYKLYPTFDNKDEAIEGIKKDAAKRLALLSENYFLAPMDQGNWNTYFDCMMKFYDDVRCPDWYKESDDEESALQCFFSLMENDQLNQEIVDDLNQVSVASQSDDADEESSDPEDILSSLPDQSMLEESLEDDNAEEESSAQVQLASATKAANSSKMKGFNKGKGIKYAKAYADEPNMGKYAYFAGRDCANFASQILDQGGVSQTKKWWHKNSNGKQDQSDAWKSANGFANYFGVGYKTHSAKNFSNNLKAGDFIATSWAKDGKWNHIEFVTAIGSKKNGSYNYQVAQHSKNYVAWTSSKINDWENQGGNDKYLGRIGR